MVDEKVMELLRSLKAIAEDKGAFPAERERAMMHLQRRLAKYQLSMMDVEHSVTKEGVVAQEVWADQAAPKGHWWSLLGNIARAHDCRIIQCRGWNREAARNGVCITWIGLDSDVYVGCYVFDYCWGYLRKQAEADGRAKGISGYDLRTYCAEYITAAGISLGHRIREERNGAAEEEAALAGRESKAGALIVIKGAAVSAFVKERFPRLGTARAVKTYIGSGSQDGKRTGETMPIRRGIRGKETKRIN